MSKFYKGPKSDHFDGEIFKNKGNIQVDKPYSDLFKWIFFEEKTPFPEYFSSPVSKIQDKRVSGHQIRITYINHATLLIQTQGLNILTDPVWSERVSPFSFLGPKRVTNPGVDYEELPPIDYVLISHNHYDHMDIETLEKLSHDHNPRFLMGLGNSYYLKQSAIKNNTELDWYESHIIEDLEFTFVPVQHWSKRSLTDTNKSLWGGFVISGPEKKIYFAGDTGYASHFEEASARFGPFDLALLPIGAYEPRWFMKEQHMNPEESVQAHLDLKAKFSIGIHFGVFQLTNEGISKPQEDLEKALAKHGVKPTEFVAPKIGQQFDL